MEKVWTDDAWKDYINWQTQDKKTLKRINELPKTLNAIRLKALENPNP